MILAMCRGCALRIGEKFDAMVKAVFTTKVLPTYDDLPELRYHFPRTYLNQVSQAVGDWIVYYEPRRPSANLMSSGGRKAYFATAKLERIVTDPILDDHFYAEVSSYLEFTRAVPFNEGGLYYESALQKADGSTNKGAFGRAVRTMADREYDAIWRSGFGHLIGLESRARPEPDIAEDAWPPLQAVKEDRTDYRSEIVFDAQRETITQLISRPFRDRAFAAAVKTAYSDTCAISGLKIINGGGRSEVQAAHIKPVSDFGPDSIRNGIALSGTVHWMFDKGLISVDDDLAILIAKDRLPDTALSLVRPSLTLEAPIRDELRPHPVFLAYHRKVIFKG